MVQGLESMSAEMAAVSWSRYKSPSALFPDIESLLAHAAAAERILRTQTN